MRVRGAADTIDDGRFRDFSRTDLPGRWSDQHHAFAGIAAYFVAKTRKFHDIQSAFSVLDLSRRSPDALRDQDESRTVSIQEWGLRAFSPGLSCSVDGRNKAVVKNILKGRGIRRLLGLAGEGMAPCMT